MTLGEVWSLGELCLKRSIVWCMLPEGEKVVGQGSGVGVELSQAGGHIVGNSIVILLEVLRSAGEAEFGGSGRRRCSGERGIGDWGSMTVGEHRGVIRATSMR